MDGWEFVGINRGGLRDGLVVWEQGVDLVPSVVLVIEILQGIFLLGRSLLRVVLQDDGGG